MIPAQLIDFMCYENGRTCIGVVDVTLPEIAFMSESIKGAGISGEIDLTAIGQLEAMTTSINWRGLIEDNIRFAAPKTYQFAFMGSQEIYDEFLGELKTKAIKLSMRCIPKKISPGKFEKNATMGTSGEFEVVYMKLSIEGKDYLEADKFNNIYIVDGVDYLAKIRRDIGMA